MHRILGKNLEDHAVLSSAICLDKYWHGGGFNLGSGLHSLCFLVQSHVDYVSEFFLFYRTSNKMQQWFSILMNKTYVHEENYEKKHLTWLVVYFITSISILNNFFPQREGDGLKSRTSCLQDLFSQWVIRTEAWPILNEMAVGQQIPAGLHCIIQLFWTHAPAVSELAAAIELLLPPICTQRIERLLQPRPRCLSSILRWANWLQDALLMFQLYIKPDE